MTQECVDLIDLNKSKQESKNFFHFFVSFSFQRLTASGNFHYRLVSKTTNYVPIRLVNVLFDRYWAVLFQDILKFIVPVFSQNSETNQ